jgi:hypothetical protein
MLSISVGTSNRITALRAGQMLVHLYVILTNNIHVAQKP